MPCRRAAPSRPALHCSSGFRARPAGSRPARRRHRPPPGGRAAVCRGWQAARRRSRAGVGCEGHRCGAGGGGLGRRGEGPCGGGAVCGAAGGACRSRECQPGVTPATAWPAHARCTLPSVGAPWQLGRLRHHRWHCCHHALFMSAWQLAVYFCTLPYRLGPRAGLPLPQVDCMLAPHAAVARTSWLCPVSWLGSAPGQS